MNDAVLSCQSLAKLYDDSGQAIEVLSGIDFSVGAGERVAIIGASGSGKSTLLHLLGGLDQPTQGKVYIGGQELTSLSEKIKGRLRNKYLGFVYQFHHLLPEFNAHENVALPLLIRGFKASKAREQAAAMIEKVGLSDRLTHRVGELSGGERQRIAIARALVTEPKCVLADEPTGNLDENTANQITDLMLKLNTELGISFVIVTHNHALADKMQRTLVLENHQLSG
ncbi:MAG: lipoprotein-releasing ABC transporter ATP-binding protein LolD [Gammaproteobacteria bacterium]|nr:lipoprotein-releasing ABC transporter ATP-binding protein LolD [Gammaproteobacteria bacterium]